LRGLIDAFPAQGDEEWRKSAQAALKGRPLDSLTALTSDGIALGPLYVGRDGPRAARGDGLGWRALSRLDHPHAGDANAQALDDIENGADGLQVVFAGAASAHGFGLSRWDAASLSRTFDGIRFDGGSRFELDLGVDPATQARGVVTAIQSLGIEAASVDVSFGLDPLGARARSGRATRPWSDEARALTDLFSEFVGAGFVGPVLVADGRPIHAAGGTPAWELAFAIASAVSYMRALDDNGVSPERSRAAMGLRMAADADQYVTICKFRALRLLWARIEELCGLPRRPARIHAESAWRMMTVRDPYVNVMRGALAAFSAGLGGADSVALLPFSQAIGLPDAFARRLARNTQLIELRESRLGFVADPAAGAGGFEALTTALCEKAWALFQTWESAGGLPIALAQGDLQKAVAAAAAALESSAARLKTLVTGVSAHPELAETRVDVVPGEPKQPEFPGEAFGTPLVPMRVAAPFERLRDAADALPERPRVFLATIGATGRYAARVNFAREFFEAGGMGVVADSGASNAGDCARRFAASGASMACLCGSDEDYGENAAPFGAALRGAGARYLLLAGKPREHETQGIDAFLYSGVDAVVLLETVLRRAGASL
jgi:methylmalonyl-CoA mutase